MKSEQMVMTRQLKSGLGPAFVNIHSILISLFFFFSILYLFVKIHIKVL